MKTLLKGKNKMKTKLVVITENFLSQQSDKETNQRIVDLRVGDLVELKEDGIYFTRKINLSKNVDLEKTFSDFK